MAMQEQESRSPPTETARMASDEPQLPRLGPITEGSAVTMATSDMAGGASACEEEQGAERAPDNIRSSSSRVALLSIMGGLNPCISHPFTCPQFHRKPRSHVPRAAPSHWWGFKHRPILPQAPARKRWAKKRDKPCTLCGASEKPLWRTWPTDRRVVLCNACGIRVRTNGVVLPELVYLPHPAPTAATTTVISKLEQPVAPSQEIQLISNSPETTLQEKVYVHLPPPATATTTVVSELEQQTLQEIQDTESPPDSPILDSMLDIDAFLLKRTSPRREKSPLPPPPPPSVEPEPAPANEKDTPEKWCLHCGATSTLQWRTGPTSKSTLCNSCGVRYRQGRLFSEYRLKASPTFNQAEHSCKHQDVLEIRKKLDHPASPAAKPIRTRKRRKGKGQQQPAQVHKKRNGDL